MTAKLLHLGPKFALPLEAVTQTFGIQPLIKRAGLADVDGHNVRASESLFL